MTNTKLIEKIIKQRNRVEELPKLPKKLDSQFNDEIIREQVYHSAKIEGSAIRLKDIREMV